MQLIKLLIHLKFLQLKKGNALALALPRLEAKKGRNRRQLKRGSALALALPHLEAKKRRNREGQRIRIRIRIILLRRRRRTRGRAPTVC
jgi:antitoxin component of MazEF toxin-antitoxin module